ncbi:MAG TPA: STT3 domain-containing protein [Thermoanaerobaculia bacterium]|jgi:asparagine N-glycosylation enzyme membrane subunit Stt3|nr:STT3 domain-containing protein [Thermoanaerobaculia bacterium]
MPSAPSSPWASTNPERLATRSARLPPWLFLAALLILAFLLRLLTLPALTQGGLRLLSADDYGHLRRAAATVHAFPRVPVFDPYLNHPHGGIWIWPPLFDLAIAAPARLFFGSAASAGQVALVAAWLPPLLGALALLPLFALGKSAFDDTTARLAAFLYALLPGAIAWSDFGHPDQHAAEALAFLTVLAAFARLVSPAEESGAHGRRVLQAGMALALAVLVWQGSVFLAPVVGAAAFLSGHARSGAWALAIAAVLVAPFGLFLPGPVTYVSFGAFQPLFLALCAVLLLLASYGWPGRMAACAVALAATIWPPIANGVKHLALRTSAAPEAIVHGGYLSYPAEWLRLIAEYRPLLAGGLGPPIGQLSGGLLLLPVVLFIWARLAWRLRPGWERFLLLSVTTLTILAMALLQRRYVYYLAPLVALAIAWLAVAVGRGPRGPVLGAALLVACLLPCATPLVELTAAPGAPGPDLLLTLARLAALDPPPGDPLRPGSVRPGEVEGVMAPWSLGHTVTLFTRRPAAADNFGYGFRRQARLLSAPPREDQAAYRLLKTSRCRYLVTTDLRPVLPAYAAAAGRRGLPVEAMLAVRVHESDSVQPLPFLRLVLVSETAWPTAAGRLVPRWKIFRVL